NADYLAAARQLCDDRGVLLIIDEVQTGFCRTGAFFACQHHDLSPDMLCLAKGIAGGVPMGAVVCSARVDPGIGAHGSTFGGNPLACAAALAAIEFMQTQQLAEQARVRGNYFASQFGAHLPERVRDVRQIGLMIGIELKEKATPYLQALLDQGILALPAGPTVIRLLPPLVITEAQLDTVIDKLRLVLA
ncbi:MAG TPA: aminotransferase class III-fold pyridoxal phosphate-dependent enzyme, partial [Gammaproteobacteria bacterium]|nr:aminotransferase class III-fold pyridoxal phosphate-dependent enzyme [Gammaproteobacteria bacterium]